MVFAWLRNKDQNVWAHGATLRLLASTLEHTNYFGFLASILLTCSAILSLPRCMVALLRMKAAQPLSRTKKVSTDH